MITKQAEQYLAAGSVTEQYLEKQAVLGLVGSGLKLGLGLAKGVAGLGWGATKGLGKMGWGATKAVAKSIPRGVPKLPGELAKATKDSVHGVGGVMTATGAAMALSDAVKQPVPSFNYRQPY